MDGSFTDYTNNLILNAIYGGSGFIPPAILYVGLSTNLLQKKSTGSSPKEPNDIAYTRIPINNNYTNFPQANGGMKTCTQLITWNTPKKDWGTIKSIFIADFSGIKSGNLIDFYNLSSPITVNYNDSPLYIPAGSFQKIFT